MALLNQPLQVSGQLGSLFEKLRQGQAPEKFNREFLKDLGFTSSNHHAFIPLLKGLGFLTEDGIPTLRYKEFLDGTKWKKVLAEAVKEAYSDIFILKTKPDASDRKMIAGKIKTTYNVSENSADRSAGTFLALLALCDPAALASSGAHIEVKEVPVPNVPPAQELTKPAGDALKHNSAGSACTTTFKFTCQRRKMLRSTMPYSNRCGLI
jgi:hypothetical protein